MVRARRRARRRRRRGTDAPRRRSGRRGVGCGKLDGHSPPGPRADPWPARPPRRSSRAHGGLAMKRFVLCLAAGSLALILFAPTASAFGWKDVVRMHRAGIADSLIVQKIEYS